MRFKKGDRVKDKYGNIDTVESVPGMKEYDSCNFVYAEQGIRLEKEGWKWQKNWRIIGKEVAVKNAKYGVKYDRHDVDPVEFFETKKGAEKRIKELLGDSGVDKETIYLFEVGKIWEVNQPVEFELIETK